MRDSRHVSALYALSTLSDHEHVYSTYKAGTRAATRAATRVAPCVEPSRGALLPHHCTGARLTGATPPGYPSLQRELEQMSFTSPLPLPSVAAATVCPPVAQQALSTYRMEVSMAKAVPITPTYDSGDLGRILAIEQRQVEETVADLTEEQFSWRPHEKAKSALEIVWHLAVQVCPEKPGSKEAALAALREAHAELQRDIATPGKLEEPLTWWTGDAITYRGVVWSAIRHRCYHLAELVYLRQVLGLDEPVYYHEAGWTPGR